MKKNNYLDLENLDEIMDLVGELLINKSRLETLEVFREEGKDVLSQLDRITAELHDKVMKLRMVSLKNIFKNFYEIIENNKEINLVLDGQDIKVDRAVINKLADPLTNLLKSSIHNIEIKNAEIRKNMGEVKKGEISITSHKTGNEVIIEFEDDGKRVDLEKLEEKIVINNIFSKEELNKMSEKEKYNLLLKNSISAEGVVDDEDNKIIEIKKVKKIIEELNGNLNLKLSENRNLKTVITIPLKFAITEALMVKVDGDLFAIPLEMVSETKRISDSEIKKVKNNDVINYREKTIPLIDSYDFLDFKKQENESSASEIEVVIVNSGKDHAALRVDELLNQQDIVVKSLGDLLSSTKNIAGATIIGDGEIALIMDVRDIG